MTRRALLAVVALAVLLAAPALASGARSDGKRASDRVPSAHLQATGDGAITLNGRLAVTGSIGRGTVVVRDRDGDARVHLAGSALEPDRRGRLRVRGASGILYVTGSRVTVQVTGQGLAFSVAGNGTARLAGSGVYQLNGGAEAKWSRRTIRISPSSSSTTTRRKKGGRRCAKCSSSAARRR